MLNKISVRHFQSLHNVELELAPFTVIVGPSSSGKSALTRALKTIAANQRGTAFIEHRQKSCLITVENDEKRISLKRSTSTGGNEYRIESLDGQERPLDGRYTKLGGTTPEEVSKALRLAPSTSTWHAGQFDKPYLLAEGGGEVARTLGSLTNVNIIFEAARESNRRRTVAAATLRTRESDLSDIKNRARNFAGLKERRAAVERAEEYLEIYLQATRRLEALENEWEALREAAKALKATKAALRGRETSLAEALSAVERGQALVDLWERAEDLERDVSRAEREAEESDKALSKAEEEYQSTLESMGQCPTCGQNVG